MKTPEERADYLMAQGIGHVDSFHDGADDRTRIVYEIRAAVEAETERCLKAAADQLLEATIRRQG